MIRELGTCDRDGRADGAQQIEPWRNRTADIPVGRTPQEDDRRARAIAKVGGNHRVIDASSLTTARRIMDELFGPPSARSFAIRYWSAATDRAGERTAPCFTLVLSGPSALRRMFLPPTERAVAEAFLHGDFDVEGELEAACALSDLLASRLREPARLMRVAGLLLRLPRRDAAARVHTLPDVGAPRPSALAPWRRLAAFGHRHSARAMRARSAITTTQATIFTSSGWTPSISPTRVRTSPTGIRISRPRRARSSNTSAASFDSDRANGFDIGCGWGGLIRYAAVSYGVDTLGITLSEAQADVARSRIAQDGLGDRCRVEVMDYRDVPSALTFDKVVSVGMFEHVGRAQLPSYFGAAMRLTRPGGLFLNHGIVSLDDARARRADIAPARRMWGSGRFMDRYVFPDGELVPLATAIGAAEAAGFETRDVENLREHYAMTLRHWVARLERCASDARASVGDMSYRVWRLYMAASAHAFATARISVAQVLLAKPDASGACDHPASRADLYLPVPARVSTGNPPRALGSRGDRRMRACGRLA